MIFISYSHADQDAARELHHALVASGLQCWRDEKCIRAGDDFAVEITRAIRECATFVLLLSPASSSSDYVWKEVAIAHHFRRPITPVLLAKTVVSDALLPYVVRCHYWDLGRRGVRDLALDLRARVIGSGDDRGVISVTNQEFKPEMPAMPQPSEETVPLVTKNAYLASVHALNRCGLPDWSDTDLPLQGDQGGEPVTRVSWLDALAYCDWSGGCLPTGSAHALLANNTVSDAASILEWRDAGNEHHKHVCDPCTSRVVAIMDRGTRTLNVGFRCITARKPPTRRWVLIEGGTYHVGTDVRRFSQLAMRYRLPLAVTRPVLNRSMRQCVLHAYAIGDTCVTNEEYYTFTKASGKSWPPHWDARWLGRFHHPFPPRLASLPVVNVSADQAQAYCIWSRTRLPSWIEWQRAATGPTGHLYPWGSEYSPQRCNSAESERGSLASADEYPLGNSAEGVRQLCGNVAQWIVGPEGTFELRGGSWRLPCELWGVAYMFRQVESGYCAADVGFRVVSDQEYLPRCSRG